MVLPGGPALGEHQRQHCDAGQPNPEPALHRRLAQQHIRSVDHGCGDQRLGHGPQDHQVGRAQAADGDCAQGGDGHQ